MDGRVERHRASPTVAVGERAVGRDCETTRPGGVLVIDRDGVAVRIVEEEVGVPRGEATDWTVIFRVPQAVRHGAVAARFRRLT